MATYPPQRIDLSTTMVGTSARRIVPGDARLRESGADHSTLEGKTADLLHDIGRCQLPATWGAPLNAVPCLEVTDTFDEYERMNSARWCILDFESCGVPRAVRWTKNVQSIQD